METKRNSDNEIANLELVLEEFSREQKSQTKSLDELVAAVNSLSDKVTGFEENINTSKLISVSTNTLPILEIVKKGVTDIKLIVATQHQKPILKKYQFLLFPEQDAKLFYKIVFGRWFLWLTIMLLFTNLLKFSTHWSDNQKEINLQLVENNRIKRAWFKLYSKPNKNLKRLMDTVYYKSEVE